MDFLIVNIEINIELKITELMYTTKLQRFLYLRKKFQTLNDLLKILEAEFYRSASVRTHYLEKEKSFCCFCSRIVLIFLEKQKQSVVDS